MTLTADFLVNAVLVVEAAIIGYGISHVRYLKKTAALLKRATLAEHRVEIMEMILQHEENIEALNRQYGAARGHRMPGHVPPLTRWREEAARVAQ